MSVSFYIGEGEGRATRDFYSEHFTYYMMFAMNFVQNEEVCKDIVQDVFVRYWEIQHQFKDEISVKSFIFKSVRNGCLNYLRHLAVRGKYLSTVASTVESEDFFMEAIVKEEVSAIIMREVGKLSPTSRKIILKTVEGFSNEEIAQQIGISVNTVKTHKARSYIILRKNLEHLKSLLCLLFP